MACLPIALVWSAACGGSGSDPPSTSTDAGSPQGASPGAASSPGAGGDGPSSTAGATSSSGATVGEGGATTTGPGGSDTAGATTDAVVHGQSVFDRKVLHVVALTVANSDLPSLDEHTEVRVPATLTFDGVTLTNVGVRNKGQSSFQPTAQKPSFSIKINEFVPGQRLDGLKKVVLNNTVQDPTWANEILTYATYRRAGLPAPRVAHAVVTLNGVPKGIYTIVEAINSQFLEQYYGAKNDHGNLYEGPWDFTKPVDDADLKDEVEEMRTRDDLQALTDAVLSKADAGYGDRVSKLLDLEQFIRSYAADVVTVAWDGYAYDAWNFYLYDNPGDGRFAFLVAGANWPYFRDQPEAAAKLDPRELPQLWGTGDPVGFLADKRVRAIPALQARFEQALSEITKQAFDVAAIHAEIDQLDATLHSTKLKDSATLDDLQTFDDHIDMAYDFVTDRKAYLLTQIQ